jgi:predicted HTH transcriptional regulator
MFRRDITEYPRESLRESIANAVAHRDYGPYVRGSYIQNYRRLNRVNMVLAGQDLRGMVQAELIEQTGFGRWTKYALRIQDDSVEKPALRSGEDKILAYVDKHGTINHSECRKMLGINEKQAWYEKANQFTVRPFPNLILPSKE